MPEQVEKRVEYRVAFEYEGEGYTTGVPRSLEEAERVADGHDCFDNVRLQRRTVETTPWEDVADV